MKLTDQSAEATTFASYSEAVGALELLREEGEVEGGWVTPRDDGWRIAVGHGGDVQFVAEFDP